MKAQAVAFAMILSSAVAAAGPLTFRQLDWSQASPTPGKLATYALVIDGKTATLDVTFSKLVNTTWEVDTKASLKGTASTDKGTTLLTLDAPNSEHPTYSCTTKKLPVAAANARRRMKTTGEGTFNGGWSPKQTTTTSALFCTRTDSGGDFYLDNELTFAKRSIEHVRADGACCEKPGDSLRFIPTNQSVTPALDCAADPSQPGCKKSK